MMRLPTRVLVLTSLLFVASCNEEDQPTQPSGPSGGSIVTGQSVEVIRRAISPAGGEVAVSILGSPLDRFSLTIPAQSFAETQDFIVSYAEITSHTLGPNFQPVSPLIRISYGGGYASELLTVRVPARIPPGHFAIGFFYDDASGRLEPVPVVDLDSTSVTLSTRHLSPSGITMGKGILQKNQTATGNLVISSMLASVLDQQPTISTGFTPGVDDWEFPNYGSYIAAGGHCAGQSMTAMWYFYEHRLKGEPPLNGRFGVINDPTHPDSMWHDNPRGYRFASTMQVDQNFDTWVASLKFQARHPQLAYYSFILAMLMTGEPQYVLIRNSVTKAGHAMVIYKITPGTGTLFVADPNYPGNRDPGTGALSVRTIEYRNGVLQPYSSALVAGGAGISFDQIGYAAKTTHIEWPRISNRWSEFQNGTIGNDRFPDYMLWVHNEGGRELPDTLTLLSDTLVMHSRSSGASHQIGGTDKYQEFRAYSQEGRYLARGYAGNGGIMRLVLPEGVHRLGFLVMGANATSYANYVDFRWSTVHRRRPDTDFARVKKVGVALLSIDTRWSRRNGDPFSLTNSLSWIADVTLSGTTLSGVSSVTEDTVTVSVSPTTISLEARGRGILGSLGLTDTRLSGVVNASPSISSGYFSYERTGTAVCGSITGLTLDTDDSNTTLESYQCLASSIIAVTFYY